MIWGETFSGSKVTLATGRQISLADRIRECFVRSENGTAPLDGDPVLQSLIEYITSLAAATTLVLFALITIGISGMAARMRQFDDERQQPPNQLNSQ